MSITIRAVYDDGINRQALRFDGSDALITADQCARIARLVEGAPGVSSYPSKDAQEEEWYGSFVPSLPVSTLPDAMQAGILEILDGNEPARDIVHKVIVNGIKASFTRDEGGTQYRVSLVAEPVDTVDVNLCGGNWTAFCDVIGAKATRSEGETDVGHIEVAELDRALTDSARVIRLADDYHRRVATRLRTLVAYAKGKGANRLEWA